MFNDKRWRSSWRMTFRLAVVLPIICSGSACVMELDLNEPVSSHDQSEWDQGQGPNGVAGIVANADDGIPIKGAVIVPRSLDQPARPVPEKLVQSGSDGHYLWPLKPGVYEVSADADGYKAEILRVEIEQKRLATLDFALQKAE